MLGKEKQHQKRHRGAWFSSLQSHFSRACFTHCQVTSVQHKLLLCLQNRHKLHSFSASQHVLRACRVGEEISLISLRNCLVLGFFHFALKQWRLIQPETGHWARHRDTCMELKSGTCLAVMPCSGLNPYQILEQQRGRPLSLSPVRNLG